MRLRTYSRLGPNSYVRFGPFVTLWIMMWRTVLIFVVLVWLMVLLFVVLALVVAYTLRIQTTRCPYPHPESST